MNRKLTVEGNREVTITRIGQWHTYDGLLEGIPTTRMNSRILAQVMDEARKFCGFNEVYLIEPRQRSIEYIGEYPFGKPSAYLG